MLKEQALRTPSPQWVRVVGGWTEFQFAERRMPTLDEINDAAPDPGLHPAPVRPRPAQPRRAEGGRLHQRHAKPAGREIQRDANGNPTGMLIARPNAMILYATLAKGPKLPLEQQVNSTRQFMRELNRLGLTSAIDAGGGFQNYPEDYEVIAELHEKKQMTIRIAYNLFTQRPGHELEDFEKWTDMLTPGQGSDFFRHNGAGEMLVFSAADFEDFLEPRPDLAPGMEDELERVVRHLVEHRWPFRLHATYNESISRMLDVFEKVNRDIPFNGLHWFFDHAETVPRPTSTASKRSAAALPSSTAWPSRASTLPSATASKPPATRRRWRKCSRPACRWA
jgi:predicted amidohydrolase YtcJ